MHTLIEKKKIIDQQIKKLNMSCVVKSKIIEDQLFLVHKKSKEVKLITEGYYYIFLNKQSSRIDKTFAKTWQSELIKSVSQTGLASDHPYVCLDYKKDKCLVLCIQTGKEQWSPYNLFIKRGYHPFKKERPAGTSTGEVSVISFLSRLLKTKFKKVRPDWLINPKTNLNLEYGSHVAIPNGTFFKDQKYTKFKDNLKVKLCRDKKITLLTIPDLKGLNEDGVKILLKGILDKNNILYSEELFHKLPFKFLEVMGSYTKDQVWAVAKKCDHRTDFEVNQKGYWRAAERLGIIEDIVSFFRDKRQKESGITQWDKHKVIMQVKVLASKGASYGVFTTKYSGAYGYAIENGFLPEVKSFFDEKQKGWGHWLDLNNAEAALKTCSSKAQLLKKFSSLTTQIRNRPDHFASLLKKYPYAQTQYLKTMTPSEIKTVIAGLTHFSDLYKKQKSTWTYLTRTNQLDKYASHLIRKDEICQDKALIELRKKIKIASKFKSMGDIKKNNTTLYKYIIKNKILDQITFKK
jgi:hypothetical protein